MKKKIIILIQSQLNSMGIDAGSVDGILGPRTMGALNQIEGITPQWSYVRKAIAFIQLIAQKKGIEAGKIDGYWGPQTDFAFDSLEQIVMEKKEPVIWRRKKGKSKIPMIGRPNGRKRIWINSMVWWGKGWLSLGRARNFDWMHVQAATL